jgi:hypothetical protein
LKALLMAVAVCLHLGVLGAWVDSTAFDDSLEERFASSFSPGAWVGYSSCLLLAIVCKVCIAAAGGGLVYWMLVPARHFLHATLLAAVDIHLD